VASVANADDDAKFSKVLKFVLFTYDDPVKYYQ